MQPAAAERSPSSTWLVSGRVEVRGRCIYPSGAPERACAAAVAASEAGSVDRRCSAALLSRADVCLATASHARAVRAHRRGAHGCGRLDAGPACRAAGVARGHREERLGRCVRCARLSLPLWPGRAARNISWAEHAPAPPYPRCRRRTRRVASSARLTRRESHWARLTRASPHRCAAGGRYIPDSASWRPSRPNFRPGFLPTYSHTCAPHSQIEKHPPQKIIPIRPTPHTYFTCLRPPTVLTYLTSTRTDACIPSLGRRCECLRSGGASGGPPEPPGPTDGRPSAHGRWAGGEGCAPRAAVRAHVGRLG